MNKQGAILCPVSMFCRSPWGGAICSVPTSGTHCHQGLPGLVGGHVKDFP